MNNIYIGIDPGAAGGIAVINTFRIAEMYAMPHTDLDIWELIRRSVLLPYYNDQPFTVYATLEKVSGYVGGAGNTGSSMFSFGKSYGKLQMALTACGVEYQEVAPVTWQRWLGIKPRQQGETKSHFKNRLKELAVSIAGSTTFPQERVTLYTADALLIAEYRRRIEEGVKKSKSPGNVTSSKLGKHI
jgi:hypothetical protein